MRKQHDDPVLHLYGSPIPVVVESKFLGMMFDRKLSYIPNIKYLKAKCLKALNLLKVLSHTSWDADRTTPLKLHRSLVQSKLEKLSLQYAIRLAANPSNSAHEVTFPPNYVDLFEQKPKAIKSFGIRISPLLESTNIPQHIEKQFTSNIPA